MSKDLQGLIQYSIINVEVINLANKDLKTRTPMSNAIDTKLLNKLKDYSNETSIPISKLLDKAIELLLKSTIK